MLDGFMVDVIILLVLALTLYHFQVLPARAKAKESIEGLELSRLALRYQEDVYILEDKGMIDQAKWLQGEVKNLNARASGTQG